MFKARIFAIIYVNAEKTARNNKGFEGSAEYA